MQSKICFQPFVFSQPNGNMDRGVVDDPLPGSIDCGNEGIGTELFRNLRVLDDVVPMLPLASGLKVEDKVKNEAFSRRQSVELVVEGGRHGIVCRSTHQDVAELRVELGAIVGAQDATDGPDGT